MATRDALEVSSPGGQQEDGQSGGQAVAVGSGMDSSTQWSIRWAAGVLVLLALFSLLLFFLDKKSDPVDPKPLSPEESEQLLAESMWAAAGYTDTEFCPIQGWAYLHRSQESILHQYGHKERLKFVSDEDTQAREAFFAKLLKCGARLRRWDYGEKMNVWILPARLDHFRPYTARGVARGWGKAGEISNEMQALSLEASRNTEVAGAYTSHAHFVDGSANVKERCRMKQRWAEDVWFQEVTQASEDEKAPPAMELIHVPEDLKSLMDGQSTFEYAGNKRPSDEKEDVCLYTTVPSGSFVPPGAEFRLLQSAVDTFLLGALSLGGDSFVEDTILTTGFWSANHWQDDREAPYYVLSPRDLMPRYDGEVHAKVPLLEDGTPYRLTWDACLRDLEKRFKGDSLQIVCTSLAVCAESGQLDVCLEKRKRPVACDNRADVDSPHAELVIPDCKENETVLLDPWLARGQAYVDSKLGEANLSWFGRREVGTTFGDDKEDVYVSKDVGASVTWGAGKPEKSLMSLRRPYKDWPRQCLDHRPLWRGWDSEGGVADCEDQSIEGASYKHQRGPFRVFAGAEEAIA